MWPECGKILMLPSQKFGLKRSLAPVDWPQPCQSQHVLVENIQHVWKVRQELFGGLVLVFDSLHFVLAEGDEKGCCGS